MRCCQSQNREHECDGAGCYGEDHNAVVNKKHGVHHGPPYSLLSEAAGALSFHTWNNSGTAYVFLPTYAEPKKFVASHGWRVPFISSRHGRRGLWHSSYLWRGRHSRCLRRPCSSLNERMPRHECWDDSELSPRPVTGGFFCVAQLESKCGLKRRTVDLA